MLPQNLVPEGTGFTDLAAVVVPTLGLEPGTNGLMGVFPGVGSVNECESAG